MPKSDLANDRSEWRVFCAVELPHAVHNAIRNHINSLKSKLPDAHASWSRPQNTHLTLKFFGNVQQSRIPQISAAAARTVKDFHPFHIAIGSSGAFPGVTRPRVLWIGVSDPDHKLIELQRRFDDECANERFPKEERKFRPHLTISRLRRPEGASALAEAHAEAKFEEVMVEVNELIVFRSELSSAGSRYTALSRHPLKTTQL